MRAFRTGLLLGAMLASGAVGAQNSGSFVLDDFSYTLVDLDPNDGIDPSLTFRLDPPIPQWVAHTNATTERGTRLADEYSPAVPAATPGSVSFNLPTGSGAASLSGSLESGLRLQASSSANPFEDQYTRTLSQANAGWLPFVLSPMTAVTFRITSDIDALSAPAPDGFRGGHASVETHLVVRSELLPDWAPLHDYRWLIAAPGQSIDQQDILEATLSNPLGREVDNLLFIYGEAQVSSLTPPPIPEPASWAMLLAGAGVMAAVARRRRG